MDKLIVTEGYIVNDCPKGIDPTTTSGTLPCHSCSHMKMIHATRKVIDFVRCNYENK